MKFSITFILYCLLCITGRCEQVQNAEVAGTWTKAKSPYYILNDIEIPDDSLLTIEPGVEVIMTGHYKIQVNGTLVAMGNAADSIYFFPADTIEGWRGMQIDNSGLGVNGAMNNNDSIRISYCVFAGAKNTGDNFYRGAAFYLREFSKVCISNCCFRSNFSMEGTPADGSGKGAGLFLRDTRALIMDCSFFNNHVADDGGALYADNAGEIKNCVFKYNSAYEDGGAIAVFRGALIHYCTIDSNAAMTQEGGGVYTEDGIQVVHCNILNNKAGGSGGGIYMLGNGSVTGCRIEHNHCSNLGGGIFINGKAAVTYCTFRSNEGYEGGGIAFGSTAAASVNERLISGCIIRNNKASVAGGIKGSYLYIVNCLITNNYASMIGGGFRGDKCTVLNTTIACNESPNTGGISSKSGNNIFNTVVWHNSEPQVAEEFSGLKVQSCAIDGNTDKSSFINSIDLAGKTPGFVIPVSFIGNAKDAQQEAAIENADWHLDGNSVLVNAGDKTLYTSSLPLLDIDSGARVQKNEIDIGAYESGYEAVSVAAVQQDNKDMALWYDAIAQRLYIQGTFRLGTLRLVTMNSAQNAVYIVWPGDIITLEKLAPGYGIAILEADGKRITRKFIQP